MLDTETGELVNLMLRHEGNEVREFYSQLPRPVLVGIRSHRIDALVSEPHGGVGNRMPSRPSRHDSLRSAAADDESRRGAGDGAGDVGIPG